MDFALTRVARCAPRSRGALRAVVEAYGEPFRSEVPRSDSWGCSAAAAGCSFDGVDPAGEDIACSTRPTVFVTAHTDPERLAGVVESGHDVERVQPRRDADQRQ